MERRIAATFVNADGPIERMVLGISRNGEGIDVDADLSITVAGKSIQIASLDVTAAEWMYSRLAVGPVAPPSSDTVRTAASLASPYQLMGRPVRVLSASSRYHQRRGVVVAIAALGADNTGAKVELDGFDIVSPAQAWFPFASLELIVE